MVLHFVHNLFAGESYSGNIAKQQLHKEIVELCFG